MIFHICNLFIAIQFPAAQKDHKWVTRIGERNNNFSNIVKLKLKANSKIYDLDKVVI